MAKRQPAFIKRKIRKSDVGRTELDMGRGIVARVNRILPADVGKTVYINLRRVF